MLFVPAARWQLPSVLESRSISVYYGRWHR